MTSTSLGYSLSNVAGYSPRLEIGDNSLLYQDPLTSYPVSADKNPLLMAGIDYYSKKPNLMNFGRENIPEIFKGKKPKPPNTSFGNKRSNSQLQIINKMITAVSKIRSN